MTNDELRALADMLDESECCIAVSGMGAHPSQCATCLRRPAEAIRSLVAERTKLLDANAAMEAALRDLAVHAENMEAQNADYHGPEGVVRSAPLNAAYVALALAEKQP